MITFAGMNLYYEPNIGFPVTVLSESESNHCVKVMRQVTGDKILVTNGLGKIYKAEISVSHHKHCEVEILEEFAEMPRRNYKLHMAVAPTKSFDRYEWMLEKLVEIGVDEITPILCEKSERDKINTERCRKVLISAMKQCRSGLLPHMNEGVQFSKFIKTLEPQNALIAHCFEAEKSNLTQIQAANSSITILIGPEGDFSLTEVEKANAQGIKALDLGNSRLRTETAALYAAAGLKVLQGD